VPRTAIIGGGVSGLAAALRIAELRQEVVLLESEGRLGGLGRWFTWRGVDLERLYHCIFRAPFVEPLWGLHFGQRRPPPITVLPGRLYMSSTAQVYPRVNSWNSCCEVVEEMMAGFTADIPERTSTCSTASRPATPADGVRASAV
jgi:hypothetical protein